MASPGLSKPGEKAFLSAADKPYPFREMAFDLLEDRTIAVFGVIWHTSLLMIISISQIDEQAWVAYDLSYSAKRANYDDMGPRR